jgi:hypothetical protein
MKLSSRPLQVSEVYGCLVPQEADSVDDHLQQLTLLMNEGLFRRVCHQRMGARESFTASIDVFEGSVAYG